MIHLICINTESLTTTHSGGITIWMECDLEFLGRYTSSGMAVDKKGNICFSINELNSELVLCERFVETKQSFNHCVKTK